MNEIIHLINEMSPYLLLGFLLAGLMHSFIPGWYYTKFLAKKSFKSVINAALFGIPLPLCSCGVIPTAMSLRKEGASKGAVASFLIATPQTGVDSIIATFSLMGLPFAIVRPIAALLTARIMEDKAPIESEYEEIKVVSDTYACSYGKVRKEFVSLKLTIQTITQILVVRIRLRSCLILECPHITCIQEHSTIKRAEQTRTIFKIENALQITYV